MINIVEYLLSKDNAKGANEKARQDLVDKLYDEIGESCTEFEKIKDDGTFSALLSEKDAKSIFPEEIVKLAKIKPFGYSKKIWTWKLDDVLEFYNYDYDKVYDLINDWFDYL